MMKGADSPSIDWLKEPTDEQALNRLYNVALLDGLPLALWRMPGRKEKHLLLDLSGEAHSVHPEVENLPAGFLFTPYQADLSAPEAREHPQSLFLNAHILYSTAGEKGLKVSAALSAEMAGQAENLILKAGEEVPLTGSYYPNSVVPEKPVQESSKQEYTRLVKAAVQEIEEGTLQKLVCGRNKKLELSENFKPLEYFRRLCEAYPNAFISFVSIPGVGSWIGASPEVLISVSSGKIFRTMALAGTQPKSADMRPSDAVWRQKEIEEQALVSRYIINCFKKIRLRDFEECGPRTVAAGNLMHLRTDFTVDMEATDFPQLGTIMLELLHPTSAVCGMPRARAKAFLEEQEKLDRQFFAGFLGPVNIEDETNLFVNLRCMQLMGKQAILYAGAGITADSDPEREWQETEEKIKTLTALLEG